MMQITKLACGVVLVATIVQVSGQEQTSGIVSAQKLNIALTGYVQGSQTESSSMAKKVKITTKDIVASLGGQKSTRLILLVPMDWQGDTMVVLRNVVNHQNQDTDVSSAFSNQTLAAVESSKANTKGDVKGTEYSIAQYSYAEASATFDVQGFTTTKIGSKGGFKSTVNGPGSVGEDAAVLSGKISSAGGREETFVFDVQPTLE